MDFKDYDIVKNFQSKFRDKILLYIDAMYNQKSELNKIQDLEERKEAACIKSGLKYNDPEVRDIINMKDEKVNDLILHYHIVKNSRKYLSLCTDQELFYRMQKRINDSIEDGADIEMVLKKRSELSALSQELNIRIDRLYSEIFATKDVSEMADLKIREMMTPEKRLRMNGGVNVQ